MTHIPDDKTDHMNLEQFEKATKLLNPDWLDDAKCQEMDIDMFFNYKESIGPSLAALKACQSCPVRKECLLTIAEFESNLNVNAGKGMFAGLTPTKRRKLYQTVAIKNYEEVSLQMLNEAIHEKTYSDWTQSAYEIEKRATAHRLAIKPNKRTQYCKLHNYPVVGLRSENRSALGKVMMYACYQSDQSHYLYRVNNQILTREEYEELCAAK
jgi:hypothetical protein